ncbi:MAG: phosphohydrolase [Hyphomicrobiales bacterium]|nr:phosphohydrolase [Hyphomicrobiales bacterium]
MRLLVVADLHYGLPKYDWLASVARNYDLLVIAGDHLDLSSAVDFRAQSVVVGKYLDRLKQQVPVLTCSGNHDLDSRNAEGEKVASWVRALSSEGISADGDSFVLDDTLFTICPWWDGPVVRADLVDQIRIDAGKRDGRRWIWVHHAPPNESPTSWNGSRSFGDAEVREWIEEFSPDIVLSGHVHQSPFVKDGSWVDRIGTTWVFNAGHQYGALPAHVIIDTDRQSALWFSAAGAQEVRLDQPLRRPIPELVALPSWLTSADPAPDRTPG